MKQSILTVGLAVGLVMGAASPSGAAVDDVRTLERRRQPDGRLPVPRRSGDDRRTRCAAWWQKPAAWMILV